MTNDELRAYKLRPDFDMNQPRPRLGKQARMDVCRKCGQEFNPPPYQDDTDHTCTPCKKIGRKANWKKRKLAGLHNFSGPHNPEKMKKRMSEYNRSPERKEGARRRASEIRKRPGFKKIQAARTLVKCALKRGDIKRGACVTCGSTIKVCAHHRDYDKPLDIVWLCYSCHNKIHLSRSAVRAALEIKEE